MTRKENPPQAEAILRELQQNPQVRRMMRFRQHGHTTTFAHCERVARLSWRINRRFRLGADEKQLLTAAMLHDFYLYDWHEKHGEAHRWHGLHHADLAAENAVRLLHVDEKVRHIIWCHMWPLNITHLPRCREAWIVCLADKLCALSESLN